MKWVLQILGILLLTLAVAQNQALGEEKESSKNDKRPGKGIYEEHCKVCHGDNGDGKTFVANVLNPPPRNFKNPLIIDALSRKQMVFSITNGRPGTGMMPWEFNLTKKEIEDVIDYIKSEFMRN